MRGFRFVDHQDRSVLGQLDFHAWLLVVVDHVPLAIPEDVEGRFRSGLQLTLQSKARALLHV